MYEVFLTLHLSGAALTAAAGGVSLYVLWKHRLESYRACAVALGTLAGFQIATGSALSVLSAGIAKAAVCERIFLYLAVISILEALLYVRMKKVPMRFPLRQAMLPIVAGLALLCGALVGAA